MSFVGRRARPNSLRNGQTCVPSRQSLSQRDSSLVDLGSDSAWVRSGGFLLLVTYLTLLAGRYSLSRLSEDLPNFDVRYPLLAILAVLVTFWATACPAPARSYPQSWPLWPWVGWLALSSVWAPAGAAVTQQLANLASMLALVSLAAVLASRLPASALDRLWPLIIIIALVYLVLAVMNGPDAQQRYAVPGGGANVFVRVQALGALAALTQSRLTGRGRFLLLVPLFAFGIILSGSRGGLVAALAVLLLSLATARRYIPLGRIAAASVVGVALAALFASSLLAQVWDAIYNRFYQQTLVQGYTSQRDVLFEEAWLMFKSAPVGGVGLGGFAVLQTETEQSYTHNLLLATAAEAGVVGVVLLLVGIVSLVVGALRAGGRSEQVVFALLSAAYILVAAMFSGDYFDSRFCWFYLVLAQAYATAVHAGHVRGGMGVVQGIATESRRKGRLSLGLESR